MNQRFLFNSQYPLLNARQHAQLRLKFMVQLRCTPRDPAAAFRQRWRRWHRLHLKRWRRTPSTYVSVGWLKRTVRYPGGYHYRPLPQVLDQRLSKNPRQRTVQRLQQTALQLRWFWRRGYGARVLHRLLQHRKARRHPRRRRDRQKKQSLRRRQRWAQKQQMPPRRLGSRPTRRRRRLSPLVQCNSLLPRQRQLRESRRLPWRLTAFHEPALTERLPRERAPTVLRSPGRRSHYPWLRVYAADRGRLPTAGREEFEPRWRSKTLASPFLGRRGRLFTNPRRKFLVQRPLWVPKNSRCWNYVSGRYSQENRHWLRLLDSGIHAIRQIQKKRSVPLGQLERLQRRRLVLRQKPRINPNLSRRSPELLGTLRGRCTPRKAFPEESAEDAPVPDFPEGIRPSDRSLWTPRWWPGFSVRWNR